MKANTNFFGRRSANFAAVLSLVLGLTISGVALTAPEAIARIGQQPIEVDPRASIIPGTPLQIGVKLTGASNITISSVPAGYVSYQGYANATDTVYATTSPNTTGTVTVKLTTDGTTYVTKTVGSIMN